MECNISFEDRIYLSLILTPFLFFSFITQTFLSWAEKTNVFILTLSTYLKNNTILFCEFIVDNHRFLRYNSLCHRQQNDNKKSDSQNQRNNPYNTDTLSKK